MIERRATSGVQRVIGTAHGQPGPVPRATAPPHLPSRVGGWRMLEPAGLPGEVRPR